MTIYYISQKRQSGVVLIISLIMLLLLTIIGVTAMQVTGLEEKMAGNNKDMNVAFQAAEVSLRDTEAWLAIQATEPEANATGSNRVWILNSMDPTDGNTINWWQERDQAWWQANAVTYGSALSTVATSPYSVIERKQYISDTLVLGTTNVQQGITYYQVTSRGTGGSDLSKTLLQSTVIRRY
ncbi:MAG: pilus assembly protein PilX [Methylophaga sp.]|nr:MAG: pilus assembly protein PilX [Methylophaga sp.]